MPFGRQSGYSQKAARQTTSSNQGNSPGPFVLRQDHYDRQTLISDRIRCLNSRLGSILQRGTDWRPLVLRGKTVAYQLPGSIGSLSCSEMLCQRQEEHYCATQKGQHHSSRICEQAGWNSVPQAEHHSQGTMALVHEQRYYSVAEHLPGVLNTIADQESRVMRDRSDWMLNPRIFNKIQQKWGPLEVDMFASRLTTQLRRFFSWRPDPEAEALNAFNQNWSNLQVRGYANPPWNLVGRVLNRIQQQQVTLVLVAPVLKSQPWYPILLEMLVDFPILLPHMEDLIIPTHPEGVPGVLPQLAAWLISGNVSITKIFQRKALSCCLHHGDRSLPNPMTHYPGSGLTGVINGIQISFQDL